MMQENEGKTNTICEIVTPRARKNIFTLIEHSIITYSSTRFIILNLLTRGYSTVEKTKLYFCFFVLQIKKGVYAFINDNL